MDWEWVLICILNIIYSIINLENITKYQKLISVSVISVSTMHFTFPPAPPLRLPLPRLPLVTITAISLLLNC